MIGNSRIIYGTMWLGGGWDKEKVTKDAVDTAEKAFLTAVEIGIDLFDFADIYQNGKSEQVFGEVLKNNPNLRNKVKIQSKAGIILKSHSDVQRYNFSSSHLISSVENSLKRLNIDYLDSFLLHRPDPLMERSELKKAFDYLFDNGIIKSYGVSNMNQYQIDFIQNAVGRKASVNQLEMSLNKLDFLDNTIGVNNDESKNTTFTTGLMEYCIQNDIELQAWSSMAGGIFSGKPLGKDVEKRILETKKYVYELSNSKRTSAGSVVLAFLLNHPANIRPVIGTTNPKRIKELKDAEDIELSREEWYKLYVLARGKQLP
ncbi:aldo/keto reductase [Geotoga petraea]|uniref:Predicted oxidoreductase n=1 Tax=Geotoga petraea TaxID=28234 RepID=A0A1G6QI13_9BACT|nr:aldo/keto reductase [Geotoga petraea]SDC91356.1 Predicted oxidoreductase [Geotoga petraea]